MPIAIPVSTSIRISYEVGEDKKNEMINNVKETATDDDIYAVAKSILDLLINDGVPVVEKRGYVQVAE